MTRRTVEPLLWTLFSVGGVLAAMLIPILMWLFALAFPLGWLAAPGYDTLLPLLSHPLARVGGSLLCLLWLLHAAHRLRYTLYDGLQIKHLDGVINLVCYGGAIAGSAWAAYLFWRVP